MENSALIHFTHMCDHRIETHILVLSLYIRNVPHMQVDIHLNTHVFRSELKISAYL